MWARAYWLQCQERGNPERMRSGFCVVSEVPSCRDEKGPCETYVPLLLSGVWLGFGDSKSPVLLLPFKKAKWVWGERGRVKGASSRRWVIFNLLMNCFPRRTCLRESRVTEDKPPSHHSLPWVTYLNNVILVLIYFLFF